MTLNEKSENQACTFQQLVIWYTDLDRHEWKTVQLEELPSDVLWTFGEETTDLVVWFLGRLMFS